eukprot:1245923-Prymnesium_polylepis.1
MPTTHLAPAFAPRLPPCCRRPCAPPNGSESPPPIRRASQRKKIFARLEQMAISKLGTQMVDFDYMIEYVMGEWQDYNDVRTVQDSVALEEIFHQTDADGNGTLDLNEFRYLVVRRNPALDDETIMDMFDNGIQLASEQARIPPNPNPNPKPSPNPRHTSRRTPRHTSRRNPTSSPSRHPRPHRPAALASGQMGEEMEAITLEAFISVASEEDLVSLAESAYVHPAGALAPLRLRPPLRFQTSAATPTAAVAVAAVCTRGRLHSRPFALAAVCTRSCLHLPPFALAAVCSCSHLLLQPILSGGCAASLRRARQADARAGVDVQ